MEVITLHQYVKENLQTIRRLTRAGIISGRVIRHYQIYTQYKDLQPGTNKMHRYHTVADNMRISSRSVMRAVSEMERNI